MDNDSVNLKVGDLKCDDRDNPLGIDCKTPRLSWKIYDERRSSIQTAYQIIVSKSFKKVEQGISVEWDTGKIESDQCLEIPYGGALLIAYERYFWRVRVWNNMAKVSDWSVTSFWEMGILNKEDWSSKWISLYSSIVRNESIPSPLLRKVFILSKVIKSARAYSTSLGLYELYINGSKVGDDCFTPGWTDYNKRVQYQTYDIKDYLKNGENVIGAILGNGWYCGRIGWLGGSRFYGFKPSFLAKIRIEYSDKTSEEIATDSSWKVSTGPILDNDIYDGEKYDARLEMDGWNRSGYNDSAWHIPEVRDMEGVNLVAQQCETVKKVLELKPIKITESAACRYIFDMGQNMAGHIRLKVRGEAGTRIIIRHAENLFSDGTLNTRSLRSAQSIDEYTCKGCDVETYEPRFTYHGFRYIEISGYPGKLNLESMTGIVISQGLRIVGSFKCSNELLNKLYDNIVWTQRSNYIEVPIDCPQRDERLGWLGDGSLFLRTATFIVDTSAFISKWMIDIEDAQRTNGVFTCVAPFIAEFMNKTLPKDLALYGWADAGILIPWLMYLVYGNIRILEEHYMAMTKWLKYQEDLSINYIVPDYGLRDWLSIEINKRDDYQNSYWDTPSNLIGTAYFSFCSNLMSGISRVLGRKNEEKYYSELSSKIRIAFNREFVTDTTRIMGNTQTAYVLALYFDLLPKEKREIAVNNLIRDIVLRDYHLTTGIVGTALALHVLSDFGHCEIAYKILENEDFPSLLYQVKEGATTIWERWDGWTRDHGYLNAATFAADVMNSYNQSVFGSIGAWLYQVVAGIDVDTSKPAYKRVLIKPRPGGSLSFASANYESRYGTIISKWSVKDNKIRYDIVIPPNTTALVSLPASGKECVTYNGVGVIQADDITEVSYDMGYLTFKVNSGEYSFDVKNIRQTQSQR